MHCAPITEDTTRVPAIDVLGAPQCTPDFVAASEAMNSLSRLHDYASFATCSLPSDGQAHPQISSDRDRYRKMS